MWWRSCFRCAEEQAMRQTARLLFVAAALLVARPWVATADETRVAGEPIESARQAISTDDLSAGRRFGGRRVFAARAWRGRLAERAGKRHRRDRTDDPPGKRGDNRPERPTGSAHDRPDPRDHVRRDDRDDRPPGGADRP